MGQQAPQTNQPPNNSLPSPGGTNQNSQSMQEQMQLLQKQAQVAQAQRDAAQAQINAGPTRPDFKGLTDAEGNLMDKFKMSSGAGYKDIATAGLEQGKTKALDEAAQSQMGANAAARTSLATRGGLTGGAALRLAQSGAQNLANARQDIGRTGMEGAQKIAEKTFDIGRQAEQTNLENLIKNQAGLNAFDLQKYSEQMKTWAASKSADAQARAAENSGKK